MPRLGHFWSGRLCFYLRQTFLLGLRRLEWLRKIKVKAKEAGIFQHDV
jgi:hypothetical protein